MIFRNGYGVLRDYETVFNWNQLSVEQDNADADAEGNLIWMHKDAADARHAYKKSAIWYWRCYNRADRLAHTYYDVWHDWLQVDRSAGQ